MSQTWECFAGNLMDFCSNDKNMHSQETSEIMQQTLRLRHNKNRSMADDDDFDFDQEKWEFDQHLINT